MAGMARAYLWRVEQGATLPSLRNLARVSVALDVPLHILLDGLDVSSVELENRDYDREDVDDTDASVSNPSVS